jgi:hypothetical protein
MEQGCRGNQCHVKNLDRNLAIIGLVSSLLAIGWLARQAETIIHAAFITYVFLACTTYLMIRPRLSARGIVTPSVRDLTSRAYLLFNITFFVILSCAILSVALRPRPYTRPLVYFVSIGILAGLLATECYLLPTKQGYEYILLAKIILVGILIRLVPQMMFPGNVWFDPWYHENFVRETLKTSHLPQLGTGSYSKLPVMHLLLGSMMTLTSLDFKMSFTLLVIPLQVILQAIFTYSLAVGFISGKKPALLATLLVTVADVVVAKGIIAYPNNLAVILLTVIIYTVFRARQCSSSKLSALCLVLMGTLILTHTIASLALAILLLCFWWAFRAYQRIYPVDVKAPPVTPFLFALFVVATLSWWMYASGHIVLVAKALEWAFQSEYFYAPAPENATAYLLEAPISEVLLDRFGFSMYYAFAALGCLYLVSKKSAGRGHGFILTIGGILLAAIGFFGPVLHAYVLPTRWYFISQVILAVPAALGIILVISIAVKRKALLLGALIGLISFSMVTDIAANFDTPVFSSARLIRLAFTRSELTSMETITDLWDGRIASDQHSIAYLSFGRGAETVEIDESLAARDFSTHRDTMILIREYITNNPFYASRTIWMLDYDPVEVLTGQRFEQLYDSGSITLFHQKQERE